MVDTTDPNAVAAPVVHNAFPARVIRPDGTELDAVRAVITPNSLHVYDVAATSGGAMIVYTPHVIDVSGMRPDPDVAGWIVETADGEWRIRRGTGCGCSSPLRYLGTPPPAYIAPPV